MRTAKCQTCGREDRISSFFHVNHALNCESCANTLVTQLKQQKAPLSVTRATDNTVCSACGDDAVSGEFLLAGRAPVCPSCHEKVYNREFPVWLKAGFGFTLVLLVLALAHGTKYFKAGRQYFLGQRLMAQQHFGQAVGPLKATLAVAPECPNCRLLLAQSELLSGDLPEAFALVKGNQFETSDTLTEVQGDFDRADKAVNLIDSAMDQYEHGHADTAIAQLHEAAKAFPQWPQPAAAEHYIQVGQTFDRNDYDGFLRMSQEDWSREHTPETAGQLSSAWACKYAVTGLAEYQQHAEDMMREAEKLSVTEEQKTSLKEYEERIRYRLTSRVIIDRIEYDRRFRKKTDEPGKQPKIEEKKDAPKESGDPEDK